MDGQPQVRLERMDTGGEPAAMVATWMMGELMNIPGVRIRLEHPDVVTLETLSADDVDTLRRRIAALLSEPRFAWWAVQEK